MANPYALSRTEQEFSEQEYAQMQSEFAAPDLDEGSPYNDEFGWGPKLQFSAQEIPDDARLGRRPLRDFRPNPAQAPEEFWRPIDADEAQRHSVEDIDADGWTDLPGINADDKRWVDNPRRTPPPETRVTERMAPRSYSFWRPFMTNTSKIGAREFNGEHFSMADHRRNYDIHGMAPVRSARNTYRIDPAPWDTDIVDVPPETEDRAISYRVQGVEVNYRSRNWRLGG